MATVTCRTCGRSFETGSNGRYCGWDCRHGTPAGYNAGCSCTACLVAARIHRARLRKQPRPLVDATGSRRRVEALAWMGWSLAVQGRLLGRNRTYLAHIVSRSQIHPNAATAISDLYDRLWDQPCRMPHASRCAAWATASGFVGPLAWDDATIDDPAAMPDSGDEYEDEIPDEVLVLRVLDGDHTLAGSATPAERTEIARRWHASGRSMSELARLTGWATHRYYRPTIDPERTAA